MAAKTATVRARTTQELKDKVEQILDGLGLNMAEAINLYLHQIARHEGIPFEVKVPSPRLQEAIREIEENGESLPRFKTVEAMFKSVGA